MLKFLASIFTLVLKCSQFGSFKISRFDLAVDCGKLNKPAHGAVTGQETTFGNTVEFSCVQDYELRGSRSRTCQANGTWSGMQPICKALYCYKPVSPPNAYQTYPLGTGPRYRVGTFVYFSCQPGYYIVGGNAMLQCTAKGWVKDAFRCITADCESPRVPTHAYITRGKSGKHVTGERVFFGCKSGYYLTGIPMIECRGKSWSMTRFQCNAVDCGSLPAPSNGRVESTTGTTYLQTYTLGCNTAKGFLRKGSSTRTCMANGKWSGQTTECELLSCGNPGTPSYGRQLQFNYTYNNKVSFECDRSFALRGHEFTVCQLESRWSQSRPACIECTSPIELENQQFSASSERNSRHSASRARLHGNSAWCSARSLNMKYLQVDFGDSMEVRGLATQGHPNEYKYMYKYTIDYTLGDVWITYTEDGARKVFKGNVDRNSVVRNMFLEPIVAKRIRINQYGWSSRACLRVEIYGCHYTAECISVGSRVLARWPAVGNTIYYYRAYITQIKENSIEVVNDNRDLDNPLHLARTSSDYLVDDRDAKKSELKKGTQIVAAVKDVKGKYVAGEISRFVFKWYEIKVSGSGQYEWKEIKDIRVRRPPTYCNRQTQSFIYRHVEQVQ